MKLKAIFLSIAVISALDLSPTVIAASNTGCLAPIINGNLQSSSGYSVWRAKSKAISGAISNPAEWDAHKSDKGFRVSLHAGVDFGKGGGQYVIPEDGNKVISATWSAAPAGYGLRVAIQRPSGDVFTYNHMKDLDPTLKKLFATARVESGTTFGGIPLPKGTPVGWVGQSGSKETVINGKTVREFPVHVHMNYIRKDQADVVGGTNNWNTAFLKAGTANTKEERDQKVLLAAKYFDDGRRYMCTWPTSQKPASGEPRLHVGEDIQFPLRRNPATKYFTLNPQIPSSLANDPALSTQGKTTTEKISKQAEDIHAGSPPNGASPQQVNAGAGSIPSVDLEKAIRILSTPTSPDDVGLFGGDGNIGSPPAPPYETFEGMSEAEMLATESMRRSADTTYWKDMATMYPRAIWMSIAQMKGFSNHLALKTYEKRQSIETLLASISITRTAKMFEPAMLSAQMRMTAEAANKKAK